MHAAVRTIAVLVACYLGQACATAALVPIDNADFGGGMAGWKLPQQGVMASFVAATAGEFTHALHVSVEVKPGENPWDVMLSQNINGAMQQADRLRLRVWMRSPDHCPVTARLQLNRAPWTGSFAGTFDLTPEWGEYTLDGSAAQSYAPDEAMIGFMLAHQSGVVEITGIRLEDTGQPAQEPGSFPFAIPVREAERTSIDVSALNPAPISAQQRISVKDGHFVDATGRHVRFLGVSVAAGSCFPNKADAEIIAARMHKYGINCVRLHHMDSSWSVPGLFYLSSPGAGKPMLTLDPGSMDRLDYFIYQLKEHGIYVDLNLHVSRPWSKENGFPDSDQLPPMGKVVAYFEPRAIQQQQQLAKDLLNHVNPYTKARYADEPALALIELDNEDSLVAAANSVLSMPPHYRDILPRGWNAYLKNRYGTTARMLAAWSADAPKPEPLGESLLTNAEFRLGVTDWRQEMQGTARYAMKAEPADALPNAPTGQMLHISQLTLDGISWHVQLHQVGLTLEPGKRYTASFLARADKVRPLVLNVRLDKDPWTNLGLDSSFTVTPQWKRYTVSFAATVPEPNHSRISFVLGDSDTDLYLADISLRRGGGGVVLPEDESLEAGNMSLPAIADNAMSRDYVSYLMQVEADYVAVMRGAIRETGATALITCSQASYGGMAGQWREAQNDWVDTHAYWQHPQFPGKPWDGNNYRIGNTPMVKDPNGGNLLSLARERVAGKPFTVSEYDHPAPSEYAAESIPVIFSFAAWQDWDGIFLFAYDYEGQGLDSDHITGYFDQVSHPGKLGFYPAAAQMFLQGTGTHAASEASVSVPADQVPALTAKRALAWDVATLPDGKRLSLDDLLMRRMETRFGGNTLTIEATPSPQPPTTSLAWDRKAGVYKFAAPNARVMVGLLGGRGALSVGSLTVTVAPSVRNFASLALVTMDGKPVGEASRLLLTAVDKAENRGVQWNPEHTFATDAWKYGPVQVTGVTADVHLPTRAGTVVVYALDVTGKHATRVPATVANGQVSFRISPDYKTIWYEIEATEDSGRAGRN